MKYMVLIYNRPGFVDELSEALGWEFSAHDFEEVMSTHYGRRVVLDDKVLFFANPEDAAEYLDFDLRPVS